MRRRRSDRCGEHYRNQCRNHLIPVRVLLSSFQSDQRERQPEFPSHQIKIIRAFGRGLVFFPTQFFDLCFFDLDSAKKLMSAEGSVMEIRVCRALPVCKLISVLCICHIRSVCAYRFDAPHKYRLHLEAAAGPFTVQVDAPAHSACGSKMMERWAAALRPKSTTRTVRMRASA